MHHLSLKEICELDENDDRLDFIKQDEDIYENRVELENDSGTQIDFSTIVNQNVEEKEERSNNVDENEDENEDEVTGVDELSYAPKVERDCEEAIISFLFYRGKSGIKRHLFFKALQNCWQKDELQLLDGESYPLLDDTKDIIEKKIKDLRNKGVVKQKHISQGLNEKQCYYRISTSKEREMNPEFNKESLDWKTSVTTVEAAIDAARHWHLSQHRQTVAASSKPSTSTRSPPSVQKRTRNQITSPQHKYNTRSNSRKKRLLNDGTPQQTV